MKLVIFVFIGMFSDFAMGFVQFPSGCLNTSSSVCHFGTVQKVSSYDQDGLKVYLGKETLLKKENAQLEWVYGSVLFKADSKVEVFFKNHPITLQKGEYFFYGKEGRLKVEVLDGQLSLNQFKVTEGFQGLFSISSGQIQLEPLQAIDLKDHVVRYAGVKNLSRAETNEYLDMFIPKHRNYLVWIDELNQKLMKRSIAQEQSALRRKRQAEHRARVTEEQRKLDFFNKVFER